MNSQDIAKELAKPFHPDDIEWRVGSTNADKTRGLALAYVTNRAIQNRLDEVFGPFGWQNQFREWKVTSQICGISVWDVEKKEWITKWDGADDSQTEAVKGGLSDSMKRAGYQWGIGRYLYNLESQWMPIEQRGKTYVLKEIPHLPEWALPEGFRYPSVSKKREPMTQQQALKPLEESYFLEDHVQPEKVRTEDLGTQVCTGCLGPITPAEIKYSTDKFGRPLCRKCQAEVKRQSAK